MKIAILVFVVLLAGSSLCQRSHALHEEVMKIISTQPTKTQFKLWHYAFDRGYDLNSEEGLQKYKAFKANLKFIKEENEKNQGYTLGLGPFTDLSWEEFSKVYLTYKGQTYTIEEESKRNLGWFDDVVDAEENLSEKVDLLKSDDDDDDEKYESKNWRSIYNYVKNQNPCGSCWAFGVVGAIEGHALIKGINIKLSEQQLVDCSISNSGCDGGTNMNGFKHVKEFGLMSQDDYPYTARDDQCKYEASKVKVRTSYRYCSRDGWLCTNKRIKEFLKDGPYSSSLLAGQSMQHYRSGNIAPKHCNTINHAVVVVYLNLVKGIITLRNSWGERWGDGGYGSLTINYHTGMRACGLLEYAFQPDPQTLILVS
jgi:C1A family cysteine protease